MLLACCDLFLVVMISGNKIGSDFPAGPASASSTKIKIAPQIFLEDEFQGTTRPGSNAELVIRYLFGISPAPRHLLL
jgi:hypothetical protein